MGCKPVAPGHEIVLFNSDSRPHAPVLLEWSKLLLQAEWPTAYCMMFYPILQNGMKNHCPKPKAG